MTLNLNPADNTTHGKPITRAKVQIRNKLGLHLRPASRLVKLAGQYTNCEILISKDEQQVNAKSVMGVIMLAAEQGSELTIEAMGDGADKALADLTQLIDGGFGEE